MLEFDDVFELGQPLPSPDDGDDLDEPLPFISNQVTYLEPAELSKGVSTLLGEESLQTWSKEEFDCSMNALACGEDAVPVKCV
jgi:hypothetical protein